MNTSNAMYYGALVDSDDTGFGDNVTFSVSDQGEGFIGTSGRGISAIPILNENEDMSCAICLAPLFDMCNWAIDCVMQICD